MPTKKYVTLRRLSRFLTNIKNMFATTEDVSSVESIANDYVLNVDYSIIQFDTSEIVGQ